MKKIFTLFAVLLTAVGMYAQDAPLYTAECVYYVDDEYGEYCDVDFPVETLTAPATVEAYDGYVIVRSIAGVAGYDMMVEYDENENVVSVTPIKEGVEGETVESGWCQIYTGLTGDWKYFNAWLAQDYVNATSDAETQSGYVLLYGYNAKNEYSYYYIYWGYDSDEVVLWENDGSLGTINWGDVNARFCEEGHDYNNECIATFSSEDWAYIKSHPFRIQVSEFSGDWQCIRLTNGWWTESYRQMEDENDIDLLQEDEDGNKFIEFNLAGTALLETIDEKHLLVTGANFVLDKVYYIPESGDEDAIKTPVLAIRKDETYNLAGQKVDAQYKGIVIRGGKKMIQK